MRIRLSVTGGEEGRGVGVWTWIWEDVAIEKELKEKFCSYNAAINAGGQ